MLVVLRQLGRRSLHTARTLLGQDKEFTFMSHMVIYRTPEGKPAYYEVDDIHDAVSFVEQLRNEQGIEQATIHRMEQVKFEYRPYFRVELRTGNELDAGRPSAPAVAAAPQALSAPAPSPEPAAPAPAAPATAPAAAPSPAPEQAAAEPAPAPVATETPAAQAEVDNGVGARRGLFGR